ncbi:hypothetical protein D3C75_1169530 [compost metagenome]
MFTGRLRLPELQSLDAHPLQLACGIRILQKKIYRLAELQTAAAFFDPLFKSLQRTCNDLTACFHSRQQLFIHDSGTFQ